MKRKLYVYIAGPYTKGDVAANVRAAIDAADRVIAEGHVPFCPHLCHFHHLVHPRPYETWTAVDLAWLEKCNVLFRLPGVSKGSDREVRHAKTLGIPVFTVDPADIGTVLRVYAKHNPK